MASQAQIAANINKILEFIGDTRKVIIPIFLIIYPEYLNQLERFQFTFLIPNRPVLKTPVTITVRRLKNLSFPTKRKVKAHQLQRKYPLDRIPKHLTAHPRRWQLRK